MTAALVCDNKRSFVPHGNFGVAFEMPDESMYPRISKGEFFIIERDGYRDADVDGDVLVQTVDGRWQLRKLAGYSDRTITLATYNPPAEVIVDRSSIAAIYHVDVVIPAGRLALWAGEHEVDAQPA